MSESKTPAEHTEDELKNRNRVVWTYRHHTGSKTSFLREKHGEYIGMVNYRPGGKYGPLYKHPTLALVYFDGNKLPSKVPVRELRAETHSSR